ncbi:MAG: hypothetical protein ATN34_00205 [Epulopiscium sp. Nele67-Bin002]|nr:MAG: (Fe-S)-binding protein [Epulopiscium sp. Nuni2H_MBin001]OON92140.1 MAG: hypothetical protein ATN34_00205 [Epulopiscium sp. Nele67-Bin002]OON92331.1 MAG: (Fe-S)-binding protein [Epulopiscium sp. Nele67-Bin001]
MRKKIIKINEDTCLGCGLCAEACHQSAIELVDGVAVVMHESICDGMGNCLPVCPVGAISFSEEEINNLENPTENTCPSAKVSELDTTVQNQQNLISALTQWPVQIKLVPIKAPFFDKAHLLIAADCTAYSYANFHTEFMRNKVTIIGCPKLDDGEYTDKLTQIIINNNLKSVTIIRMQVPCCRGIERATVSALQNSGKFIPWQIVVISTNGEIIEN